MIRCAISPSTALEHFDTAPSALRAQVVAHGPARPSYGRVADLPGHLDMIAREFSGRSALELHHAQVIVCLRRGIDVPRMTQRFRELWADEEAFLTRALDSRWLVSACDTIADHSGDRGERQVAVSASLLMATLKLYETERLLRDREQGRWTLLPDKLEPGLVPLFDGLSAYRVGGGDMVANLLQRVRAVYGVQTLAARLLAELLRRAHRFDTVFRRMAGCHRSATTRWWSDEQLSA